MWFFWWICVIFKYFDNDEVAYMLVLRVSDWGWRILIDNHYRHLVISRLPLPFSGYHSISQQLPVDNSRRWLPTGFMVDTGGYWRCYDDYPYKGFIWYSKYCCLTWCGSFYNSCCFCFFLNFFNFLCQSMSTPSKAWICSMNVKSPNHHEPNGPLYVVFLSFFFFLLRSVFPSQKCGKEEKQYNGFLLCLI